MSIAEKLVTVAENVPKVYDKGVADGQQIEHDRFWDAYQEEGNRKTYQYAFYHQGWDENTFQPKYDIVCDGSYTSNSAFAHSRITEIPVTVDFSKCTTELSSVFANCIRLKSIKKVIFSETNTFYNPFVSCTALENITVEGTIGNSISFQWSPLTHESLMSILNALQDKSADTSGTVWSLTLGPTNCAKLSDEEMTVATAKGWVVN